MEEEEISDHWEETAPIEDANAALERELIAHYLKPFRALWDLLPPEEKERLRAEALTWASNVLARPNLVS
jgi:hypothetical protein